MTKTEQIAEATDRAVNGTSVSNYGAIIAGFIDKGIPESEILPRVNVFTFNVWTGKGRRVLKGETSVKIVTWIPTNGKQAAAGTEKIKFRQKTASVFHISQTETQADYETRKSAEKAGKIIAPPMDSQTDLQLIDAMNEQASAYFDAGLSACMDREVF